MKKIISLILTAALAILMVFSLASCNANPEDTLVCGVTIFTNMNEQNPDGTWTGFETEFAEAVAAKLGMKVKFVIIDWDQKYNEVNSNAIDCIWNGFTANSADDGIKRADLVDFSYGYMNNQQCVVVKTSSLGTITAEADLAGKQAVCENGSAGAAYAEDAGATVIPASNQISALMDLKSGGSDFAVVDKVLAQNICGKGDYTDLAIVETIVLESEVYAIGFAKGNPLKDKVNAAMEELFADGTLARLAAKYGFENVVPAAPMKNFQ